MLSVAEVSLVNPTHVVWLKNRHINSAFGSTGAFGQPQQPANPMFGNLTTPNPTTNTGFGPF